MSFSSDSGRVLIVLDLQRVVGPGGAWELAGLDATLVNITRLMQAFGDASVVTRHRLASDAPGRWAAFAQRWEQLDRSPENWDLLDEVALAVPVGAAVVDKYTYSAFDLRAVQDRLDGLRPEVVIVGCETDCCVAATMFAAVDAGVPVTLVTDAIAGPDPGAHEAMLRSAGRLPEQVRLLPTEEMLGAA